MSAISPARSASWRWPGARIGSATPPPTSSCAIRSCSRRRCRAFFFPAIARAFISISTTSKAQAGDYTIAVTGADALAANANQKLTLRAKERGALTVPLTASAAGSGTVRVKVSGPVRFCAGTKLRAHGAVAGANPGAAHDQADRQGRKSDGVERPVCRSRPRHRRGVDFGRRFDGARCGEPCWRRSIAIRIAVRSRSRAARCRCSMSAIWPKARTSPSIRRPISAFATPSRCCSRGRTPTVRSASGVSAAMTSGSTPTSPTF